MYEKLLFWASLCALVLLSVSASISTTGNNLKDNFVFGDPEIASIEELTFGPEGILFIGDTKNATIYALDTKDMTARAAGDEINISGFDDKVAASLGTTAENIKISDMVVNPISKTVYLSVNVTDGTPVLLKLNGDKLENVSLKNVSYSKISLQNPVDADAKDRWERPLRVWAISDLKYHDGKVLVSGLSNKEFGSTFRSIPFPFTDIQNAASLEIWHAAHGKFETHAPIKAFDIINIDDTDYLMASYTCTPLVLFPLSDLKDGVHSKGRTVAELGAGNSPVDMISYVKEGKKYFLMSNSNRPVMRFKYETIANFKETMTETVSTPFVAKGVAYDNLPFPYVLQMDRLDDGNVVYVQRTADGDMVIKSRTTKWM